LRIPARRYYSHTSACRHGRAQRIYDDCNVERLLVERAHDRCDVSKACGYHRGQAKRQSNRDALSRDVQRTPCDRNAIYNAVQILAEHDDIRGLGRDPATTRRNRNTDVGRSERRRVIDAIADHGGTAVGGSDALDVLHLVLR
jgi:hypothetical protein